MTLMVLFDAAAGVALWIAGLVALVLYYRFALTSTAGFRVAMTAFWRRLAAIALPAIVVWLIARLVVESYGGTPSRLTGCSARASDWET
jgi:uncharacterized membrane protein YjjB (DUF3815 family)